LAELYKKYSEEGFHIVGLECQGSAENAIVQMCKDKGVTFQITTGGDLKGANVRGIPHGFLFGADGKLVGEPHPGEVEAKIKDLLKETSAAMAGPGPYVKLAALAAQIKSGNGLGTVLKTLRTKKDSKDEAEAKEAAMMFESLSGAATRQLEGAIGKKESEPMSALKTLDKLALQFTGDEIGTKAKSEADAMRKDPKIKKEVEAETMFKTLADMEEKLKPFQGSKNPKADGFKKLNQQALVGLVGGCQTLIQRYPETGAAKKAQEMMEQYK